MGVKLSKGLCSRGSSLLFRHSSHHHVHARVTYVRHDQTGEPHKSENKYSRIDNSDDLLEQFTLALAEAGLVNSKLIVGIAFTKSNEWTGARSFNQQSLHHIGVAQNPYEQAISIIGRTLIPCNAGLMRCFGFGDVSTHDHDIFSFYQDRRPCNGVMEALTRYREIVSHLQLAGPTSFAPIIEMAMTIVEQSGGWYHVLMIVVDGLVIRSVDTECGQLSQQEEATVEANVKARCFRE